MIQLKDQCRNKWPSILSHFGFPPEALEGKHGPCPLCGGRDRFRFDDKDGRGTYYCSGCGAGDGISLLLKKLRCTFAELAAQVRPILGEVEPTRRDPSRSRDPLIACQNLWRPARSLREGDAAMRYLRARGLDDFASSELRFAAECRVTGLADRTTLPALLARVTDPDGEGASIHRTYLGDAAKAPIAEPRRMMPGKLPKGSAVRLRPHTDRLGVAEGIETALAVWMLFGIPCWSTINATMMREFVWPEGLVALHIFADHDVNYAGQAAAYQLAHRAMIAAQPVTAHVHLPPTLGVDWLDELNAKRADAA